MTLGRQLVLGLLRLYKLLVSPFLHTIAGPLGGCRYTPTCSVYAAEAVALHGVIKGSWLAVRRVCRCHPWGGSGQDFVPARFDFRLSCRSRRASHDSACCSHVGTQHAAHFGCPPPAH